MTDLMDQFRTLDRLDAPDLWPEVERRRPGAVRVHHRPSRFGAAALAFAVAAVGVVIVIRAFGGTTTGPAPSPDPLAAISVGWTRLPEAPETTQGSALLWTGTELLSWGGYRESDKSYVADGFAFDPSTQTWSSIPSAPAGRSGARAVWTGTEAIFWGGWDGDRTYSDGFAFDPTTLSWRTITSAPIDPAAGAIVVWTGTEMIVWGGGNSGDKSNDTGVAYDPSTGAWHQIADAPVGLNLASAVWTGTDLIVFGSLLDGGNHAATQTAVGASYDPSSDTWREIAGSDLSPQAVTAVWVNDRMIAYDYNWKAEAYSPSTNEWASLPDLPFQSGECYPDGALVGTHVFALGCGEAATWGVADDAWHEVHGGMTGETIEANGQSYKLWRFATLVPAGDVLFLSAEGLTVNKNGVPCYGCAGSPTSLWAYRTVE